MLSGLTRRLRIRAAIAIAVAYAFCVVAPYAALAFVDSATALHCLTDLHGIATNHDHDSRTHVHADGASDEHADTGVPHQHFDADGKSHSGNCCGLFCMSALAHDLDVTLGASALASPAQSANESGLSSRGPDLINRPPIP